MRKSFSHLQKQCVKLFETGDTSAWWSDLGSTNWFHHISTILVGAARIVQSYRSDVSVLVHCSDGWDRTSQVSSHSEFQSYSCCNRCTPVSRMHCN